MVAGVQATPYECGPNATVPLSAGRLLTAFRLDASAWTQLASLGTSRAWSASAVAADGRMFTFGGQQPVGGMTWPVVASMEVYDPAIGVWSP
jgi:hypothetical protein